MNESELIAASDKTYFESWRSFAEPAGFIHEADGILITAPSTSLAWLNVVFVTQPLRDPKAQLAQAFDLLDRRKLPFFVHMRDGMDAASESACEQLGFVSEIPVPGMVLSPLTTRRSEGPLEIREATDDATFADFLSVSSESFGIPPDDGNAMFPPSSRNRPNNRYWVGYADGRPVACSNLLVIDSIAGVNMIGTVPDARGKGYGEAVTWQVVNAGAAAGCSMAVLQASEMGQPVYTRMGFRTVTTYKTYLRPG